MATLLRTGTLLVSVDLPASRSDSSSDRLGGAIDPLVELLTEFEVSATWGVSSPTGWREAEPLVCLSTVQELSILGDESWAATFPGRERFYRGLALHQNAAAKIGYRPTTFAFTSGSIVPYTDLAQKCGITATRSQVDLPVPAAGFGRLLSRFTGRANDASSVYRPQTVRFGLWDLKPSAIWPHPARPQSTRVPVSLLRRGLEQAITLRGVYHLVLDGSAIAAAGDRAIRGLRKFLAHAVRRREQTRLAILSMREVATRLSSPRASGAARSILHARAA